MEKLDKETLTQQLSYEGKAIAEINGFKNGLEYAENYYLKLINNKDKEIQTLENVISNLSKDHQTAKELLKEAQSLSSSLGTWGDKKFETKIEEFLKQ